MQNYGNAIKRIRKSRGLSQKYVGQGILSQAAFSKFEAGLTTVHSTAFFQILDRLSMSFEEFEYIINDYEFPQPKNIINKFFKTSYNSAEDLKNIIAEIDTFLDKQQNIDLENIKIICTALISLNQNKDILQARSYVEPIWIKLSKVDQWYLTDIRIIHSILYFFPNDIAIEMANTLLSRIYNYKDFQDSNRLVTTLKLNLSLLLIKEKDFKTALNVLEGILKNHKVAMAQQSLSVLFIRVAICRKMLQLGKEEEYLEQAAQLLKIYDQEEFLEQVMKDYMYYTNLQ
ncbi:helix-turn-helix domain-containing protein [Planococcus sp. MERTA32b]|nr:helix-turn-helix domain-containing protein [Planococcus sp. MER TA 32b]